MRLSPSGRLIEAAQRRLRLAVGRRPVSETLGNDRRLPICRYYTEQFLSSCASDVRGSCLEFQEDRYTTRFGGPAVSQIDILHLDKTNPLATVIADLTKPNDIPTDRFDCIVCTFVLQVILDAAKAVAELRRILKPGGVLLAVAPHLVYGGERDCGVVGDFWRFTPAGLKALVSSAFGEDNARVRGYGNSLTAAGQIRGLVSDDFTRAELDYYDPHFAVTVCARAVKTGEAARLHEYREYRGRAR